MMQSGGLGRPGLAENIEQQALDAVRRQGDVRGACQYSWLTMHYVRCYHAFYAVACHS